MINNIISGYYTLFSGADNQFYFNLKAGNNEIILQSEGYTTKSNALNGIQSVQKNCPENERYQRKKDKNGNPYFVLTAKNGEPIGKSESYSSEQMMERGIESVKANGISKEVNDETDNIFIIHINKKMFKVTSQTMTGNDLLALVGQSSTGYCIFLIKGNKQDEVKPNESITIENGMHFQTIVKDIKFG
ncbi:YegP family protein [Fluviicola sp. SGL-29]|nr:YegP family protein [Fluviicola sp. SGL-29]